MQGGLGSLAKKFIAPIHRDGQEFADALRACMKGREYDGTVGVVTPFRQQMIRLKDALETEDALPKEFSKRTQLLNDTAYGFQGGERDLILFSLCGGPDLPPGGQLFFNKDPNQFNVAVSRARAVLHVVGNREWALHCGFTYIEKLAQRTMPVGSGAATKQRDLYQLGMKSSMQ